KRQAAAARKEHIETWRAAAARHRYERWKTEREGELEEMAQSISQRIDF
ncbi:MAG: hypothetical protein H7Z38_08325, partial [Rubrivivax sp.]|nr:hypothetical protein [Pyrinomonadaceae bacterium]